MAELDYSHSFKNCQFEFFSTLKFLGLSELTDLELSQVNAESGVTRLDRLVFNGLGSLKYLSLSGNGISELPEVSINLIKIVMLQGELSLKTIAGIIFKHTDISVRLILTTALSC